MRQALGYAHDRHFVALRNPLILYLILSFIYTKNPNKNVTALWQFQLDSGVSGRGVPIGIFPIRLN